MQSKAATVKEYLASLPSDRREAIEAVRSVILKNLDRKFEEGMQYGMIGYYVPHSKYPAGYHCDPRQPLPYAGLASQKNHMSLYLLCLYMSQGSPLAKWFQEAWAKSGKKLDAGKACIRFKTLDDLALDVIGEAIKRMPADAYIQMYQRARDAMDERPVKGPPKKSARAIAKKAEPKKAARKKTAKKSR